MGGTGDLGAAAWRLDNPPDMLEHTLTSGWLANEIVTDSNLMAMLFRFLSYPTTERKVGR